MKPPLWALIVLYIINVGTIRVLPCEGLGCTTGVDACRYFDVVTLRTSKWTASGKTHGFKCKFPDRRARSGAKSRGGVSASSCPGRRGGPARSPVFTGLSCGRPTSRRTARLLCAASGAGPAPTGVAAAAVRGRRFLISLSGSIGGRSFTSIFRADRAIDRRVTRQII